MLLSLTELSIAQNKRGSKWFGPKDNNRSGFMPLYDFKDLTSGEVYTKMMSIADMEEYVKDKNIQQVISAPMVIGEISGSVGRKAGDGWKEVQSRIKSGLPPALKGNIDIK